MSSDKLRDLFAPWREKHARPAWKPIVRQDDDGETSRFGGSPILANGEAWPSCGQCGEPLQFFLQLELSRLPAALGSRGQGLLQLFYCSKDDGNCETWAPFSGAHLVRLFDGKGVVAPHPDGVSPFPARALEGWQEMIDAPHSEEHATLGLEYTYDQRAGRISVRCEELGLALTDLDKQLNVRDIISAAAPGDKLGGWPYWVQGAEYPRCPTCDQPMELLLQLDSEDNVPHMFGDAGCGHITQCPVHRDTLAFGWACC